MATRDVPPGFALGSCKVCGARFEYASALSHPPKTCGLLKCMVTVGETRPVR